MGLKHRNGSMLMDSSASRLRASSEEENDSSVCIKCDESDYTSEQDRLLSKFYCQPMNKRNALKGVLKFTLKMLQHVSV